MGGAWLTKRGYSVLGVKPKAVDRYRGTDLHAFLLSPGMQRFFAGFETVALHGGSMEALRR